MSDKFTPLEIGKTIKEYRKANGLTQVELGAKLGIADTAISKYEKGQISNIPLEVRLNLVRILGIPLSKLNIDKSFYIDETFGTFYGENRRELLNSAESANSAVINYLNEVHRTDAYYPVIERQEYWLIDKSAYTESDILQIKYLINTFLLSQISDTEFQQIKNYIEFIKSQRQNKQNKHNP